MNIRSVNLARLCYLLLCELAGVLIALSTKDNLDFSISVYEGLFIGLLVAGFFIYMESLMKGFSLRGFSTATFGILVGLLCAWLLTRVGIDDLIAIAFDDVEAAETVALAVRVIIFGTLGFIGAVLALRSAREDFAFIIPYVRFRSDSLGGRPVLLDASTLTDGRVARLVKTGFLTSNLVIPNFELNDIQLASESGDPKETQNAKKALSELDGLRNLRNCQLQVHDSNGEIDVSEGHHARLVQVARLLGARILTRDEDLAQMGRLRGVDILSINELAEAVQTDVSIGDKVKVYLVKGGKDSHQGVGYLPNGTMIVVNHAAGMIGSSCLVLIVGNMETNSGVLYFAELA